ncbi:MAG: hypothetical protein AB2741_05930 [Exiguobacterium sp.]
MSPDMLIVDLSSMIEKKTVSASYPHLLQTMEHLCDQLGAPLLYKNISHFDMRGSMADAITWGIF